MKNIWVKCYNSETLWQKANIMDQAKYHFEQDMNELEQLIIQMEQGELSLEASLQAYEKGIVLSQRCQAALDEATKRIQALQQVNKQDE